MSSADFWKKSTHSGTTNCVEVSAARGSVVVRDSKRPDGPRLRVSAAAWDAFLSSLRTR
ncbi:DUF397 domain-containing protein [Cryptosporangium phraense]|uniref:DUF397 domain-containing protein n=2 Tax=Cryptosporangium phraense TaxID=2593070 RepID=A0A545AGQ1_9ACTN|nr:DUF397 domain-containing protein [Cryptosporangium phraense]